MKHEQAGGGADGLGVNIRSDMVNVLTILRLTVSILFRSIVVVAVLMLLMMFAVHCTWVTSNAYSSPSIVLASYGNDGSRQVREM